MLKFTLPGIAAIACLLLWLAPALADDSAASPSSAQSPPSATSAPAPSATHEQQWLVDSIGKDIAEIILFAAKSKGAENIALDKISCTTTEKSAIAGSYSYELKTSDSAEPETADVHLSNYFWCPENFSPWADQLLKKYKLSPTTQDDQSSTDLIKMLSGYNSPTIAEADKDIAKLLTKDPLNAAVHEQAALLIATQSLRECAACFSDLRPGLNRVSAHLAIARALRGGKPYGDAGKLAEVTLISLSGRSSEALPSIKSMRSATTDKPTLSWLRGLEMRETMDPRISENETVMEELEYARALSDTLGADQVTDYLMRNKGIPRQIDFMRIGVRGIESVEAGHHYGEPGVAAEREDFINNYGLYHDTNKVLDPGAKPTKPNRWPIQGAEGWELQPLDWPNLAELNKLPTRCLVQGADGWELQPLSWPDVAAFHCRHILDAVFQAETFERHMWNVDEAADRTTKMAEQAFSTLTLYPLLKSCLIADVIDKNTDKNTLIDAITVAAVGQLVQQHPENVNYELWAQSRSYASIPSAIQDPNNWFVPRFLYGTAFDFSGRIRSSPDALDIVSIETMERLKKLSPYDFDLDCSIAYKKYGRYADTKATPDQLKELFGKLLDYHLGALNMVSYAYDNTDPGQKAEFMEKMAELSPDRYFALGNFYLLIHQPEKAVAVFEKGLSKARDAVHVSNSCQWLVKYYDEHGQRAKALDLAKQFAEVYSSGGLDTLALEYERMGNLSEAENYFKQDFQRYGGFRDLCAFYIRHEKDDPRYKQEADKCLSKIFPNGMKRVTLQDFKEAPTTGIELVPGGTNLNLYKLKIGDVVVALDSYQINTTPQWKLVKCLIANDDDMDVIVWDGKAYRAFKAVNLQPHTGWMIRNFTGKSKAAK